MDIQLKCEKRGGDDHRDDWMHLLDFGRYASLFDCFFLGVWLILVRHP